MWIPEADEFAIVAPWRNRNEIGVIEALSAVRFAESLANAAREQTLRLGSEAVLMIEWNERRNPAFYERTGMSPLDEVIAFDRSARGFLNDDVLRSGFQQLAFAADPLFDQIVAVDHLAFPWLWQNSRLEFERYVLTPGVEIWAMRSELGETIAYIGVTAFSGWGHIDRVAVRPDAQGRGFGQRIVRFGIERLIAQGATRVGLSTQLNNWQSQRLYHRLGFQRTRQNDYRIYGYLTPGLAA